MGNEHGATLVVGPEVVELVGRCALPVVQALDEPAAPAAVARAARRHLDELAERVDAPREVLAAARRALVAARSLSEGTPAPSSYADFLRATHELLARSGLPAPRELSPES